MELYVQAIEWKRPPDACDPVVSVATINGLRRGRSDPAVVAKLVLDLGFDQSGQGFEVVGTVTAQRVEHCALLAWRRCSR